MIIKDFDEYKVREIHEKYYKDEFSMPEFFTPHFMDRFQVENEEGRIITAGGFRVIPEMILITDKDAPVLDRRIALLEALDLMIKHAQLLGFNHLHAFVQDRKWNDRLRRTGFHPPKGECLILEV